MAHSIVSADEALKRLKDGNRRYVAGLKSSNKGNGRADAGVVPTELVEEQDPFAVILGCSDARVPVETIFDQGLGELFVIRVAGNVVAPEIIGSIEYAASLLGTRLVVVLGHTRCGAVQASVDALSTRTSSASDKAAKNQEGGDAPSPHLQSIIDRVMPSVQVVLASGEDMDEGTIARQAVRRNVRASTEQLLRDSKELETLHRNEGLRVVGAEYAVETGAVAFLDD